MGIVIWVLAMTLPATIGPLNAWRQTSKYNKNAPVKSEHDFLLYLTIFLIDCVYFLPIGAIVWFFVWDLGDQPETAILIGYAIVLFVSWKVVETTAEIREKERIRVEQRKKQWPDEGV